MKRTICMMLACCLLLGLAACGDAAPKPEEPAAQTAAAPAAEPSPTPAPTSVPAPSPTPTPIADTEDRPANMGAAPENVWVEVDYDRDGIPFDPDAPARDGHVHEWVQDLSRRRESTCTEEGEQVLVCAVCGREYTCVLEKKEHSFHWDCNDYGHRSMCAVCGQPFEEDTYIYYPHNYVMVGNNNMVCTTCGWVRQFYGYYGG